MSDSRPAKSISIRFPPDVWEALRALAAAHERSFNGEVIWAVRAYIQRHQGEGRPQQ